MQQSEILLKLKNIKPELEKKYGLTTLALFGSYSRNEQRADSDIDLLIDFDKMDVHNFFDCAFELQDLFKSKEVQIVTRDGIKPKYFDAIKQDLLYA
jgi:predicted nucleotidyltransferase